MFKRGSGKLVESHSVVLPEDLYEELDRIAKEHNTSVVKVARKIFQAGLLMIYVEDYRKDNARIILRDDNGEKELVVFEDEGDDDTKIDG